jgi:hypothetical protein
MHELKLCKMTIRSDQGKKKLTETERETMIQTDWGEVNYLIEVKKIPLELVFNLDETACRLSPILLKAWMQEDSDTEDVAPIAGLTKSFLTVICGMNALGDLLPSTTHWNGLTEASLPLYERRVKEAKITTRQCGESVRVRVYLGSSRWACVESVLEFLAGIEVRRIKYAKDNRKKETEVLALVVIFAMVLQVRITMWMVTSRQTTRQQKALKTT